MHKLKNLPRRLSQIFFLVVLGEFAFYGIFRCPFAVPYTDCGACPVVQCPGKKLWIGFWVLLPVTLLLFGRGFCSWACPGGLFSDMVSKISILKGKVSRGFEKNFSLIRYVILAAGIVFVFVLHNPRWAIPIRTGEFFNSIKLTFEHADTLWLLRTAFILSGFLLIILIPHFWCRYLCPTGGMLDVLKKISLFKYRMTDACNQCNVCRKACPVETRPAEINCTNCGACKGSCPVDAIKFKQGY
jgi:ferredoxin-type protein NapH